ncbi:PspC domain-containing protein [Allosphingosinicella indica]|uniref:Phage shock protein C (PspC) family protein n=1 Tax=Allosphingosinicella indica TaxID=941907 RepID=A0A1X7G3E0_9SPHN|nr:PspC domain-containing protein [Allosphingosinicella indica]SMF63398.1 phage shock protein C (PspC) family protein [Allosphingosinicella indica]
MTDRYLLDKDNAKLMGVCAGLSNHSGMDAMGVRIIAVLLLFLLGPITILAYLATGLLANSR